MKDKKGTCLFRNIVSVTLNHQENLLSAVFIGTIFFPIGSIVSGEPVYSQASKLYTNWDRKVQESTQQQVFQMYFLMLQAPQTNNSDPEISKPTYKN